MYLGLKIQESDKSFPNFFATQNNNFPVSYRSSTLKDVSNHDRYKLHYLNHALAPEFQKVRHLHTYTDVFEAFFHVTE